MNGVALVARAHPHQQISCSLLSLVPPTLSQVSRFSSGDWTQRHLHLPSVNFRLFWRLAHVDQGVNLASSLNQTLFKHFLNSGIAVSSLPIPSPLPTIPPAVPVFLLFFQLHESAGTEVCTVKERTLSTRTEKKNRDTNCELRYKSQFARSNSLSLHSKDWMYFVDSGASLHVMQNLFLRLNKRGELFGVQPEP